MIAGMCPLEHRSARKPAANADLRAALGRLWLARPPLDRSGRRPALCHLAAAALTLAVVSGAATPRAARANGAFPDTFSIFAPADHKERIILGTTFGLILSEDGGASWRFLCEEAIASLVLRYQLAADGELYAQTIEGVSVSRDLGCTWEVAMSEAEGLRVYDFFADPTAPGHLLLLGPAPSSTIAEALYDLSGVGPPRPLLIAPPGRILQSTELAASDPQTIYLTATTSQSPARIFLLRSEDGGATFDEHEVTDQIPGRIPRITTVDPLDRDTLYLRLLDASGGPGDQLAISRDGGRTLEVPLMVPGRMSGFAVTPAGELFVLTRQSAYRAPAEDRPFEEWMITPHLRALAERDGTFYGAADNFVDGFAVGASDDGGATWAPLIRFETIDDLVTCEPARTMCKAPWAALQAFLNPTTTPTTTPQPPPPEEPDPGCTCTVGQVHRPGMTGDGGSGDRGGWWIPGALGVAALLLRRGNRSARLGG